MVLLHDSVVDWVSGVRNRWVVGDVATPSGPNGIQPVLTNWSAIDSQWPDLHPCGHLE